MNKIKKVIQFVEVDENNFSNNEGNIYVFFEDESIAPEEISADDAYLVYLEMAKEKGIDINEENLEQLEDVLIQAEEDGKLTLCNSLDPVELDAANAEFKAAKERAEELSKGKGPGGVVIPPVVPGTDVDYTSELTDEVTTNKHTGLKVGAGILGATALGAALYGGIEYAINHSQNTQDMDNNLNQDKTIDFDNGTFDELMGSMDENDQRKIVAEKAMNLVNSFHNATHKDNNFRLAEDAETYLDLSFEEALVLTTFANYSNPSELYDVLGTFNMTAEAAKNTLESARTKLITYYMNAKENSGLAEIFANENDKQFFIDMENSVINFNAMHSTDTSDQVIRNVYYNYILDGSTSNVDISPMARLLAFDSVYGGLNLTESASVNHTQYLEFKGMGIEEETKYYVNNVLGLNYDSLSEEEISQYRRNIIEAGTDLVNVLPSDQTLIEENSIEQENNESLSLTNLVDKMGICNSVNEEIDQKMEALDEMSANKATSVEIHVTNANSKISLGLREAGLDDLAVQVEASMNKQLNAELIKAIRDSGSTGVDLLENYETTIAAVTGSNRPSMEQIVNAANRDLSKQANYNGGAIDVSTLVNNRRHGPEKHLTGDSALTEEEKDKGIIGKDENDVPIFDKEVIDKIFEDLTDEGKKDFIIENGTVIEEETNTKDETQKESSSNVETPKNPVITEEVKYEDLTSVEKEVVDQEKIDIFTKDTLDNIYAAGQIDANMYENDSQYVFNPGKVVNPVTGNEYDLNEMNFASAIARLQAFRYAQINPETGLIERSSDYSLDADKDAQLLNTAEVSAEQYLNALTEEEKSAIAEGMAMSWEDAREQLKESYKKGYIDRMQTAINLAINEGNEQFKITLDAQKKVIEQNKENEKNAYLNPEVNTQVTAPIEKAPELVEEEREVVTTGPSKIEETVVTPDVQPTPVVPSVEISNESTTAEEEFDWGSVVTMPGETSVSDDYINSIIATAVGDAFNDYEIEESAVKRR